MENVMPIDPKDIHAAVKESSDAVLWFNAIKSQWQTIAGSIVGGGYAVWKYLTARMARMESKLAKIVETRMVTREQMTDHNENEDRKFDALLRQGESVNSLLLSQGEHMAKIAGHLEGIDDTIKFIRERQLANEGRIQVLEQAVTAIQERHRMEELRFSMREDGKP